MLQGTRDYAPVAVVACVPRHSECLASTSLQHSTPAANTTWTCADWATSAAPARGHQTWCPAVCRTCGRCSCCSICCLKLPGRSYYEKNILVSPTWGAAQPTCCSIIATAAHLSICKDGGVVPGKRAVHCFMYAVVVHHILADILQHAIKLQQSATATGSQTEALLLRVSADDGHCTAARCSRYLAACSIAQLQV
jgi:hypothetical protein